MSENLSLPASSHSPVTHSSDNMNSPLEPGQSDADSQTHDWEVVPIPGTADSAKFESIASGSKGVDTKAATPAREGELLTLIHDLNQCNDVLLSRVTQLESALEQSQANLKNEVASAQVSSGNMARQVSAQQASVQQVSYNAQQQIAKLVGKLDNAEQALNRQLLINENLQTEVSNNQERISQLERECTIVAQQHLAEVQARAKAESASRDLRSRLQRQQRYTMQFKAALEKSLTVTVRPSDAAFAEPVAFKDSTAVVMPKAQRIMPWVSDNSSPFAGIDPHLESLIRRVGKSEAGADASRAIAPKEAPSSPANEPKLEAENKLWQDLERVISHTESEKGTDPVEQTINVDSAGLLDDPQDLERVISHTESEKGTDPVEQTINVDSAGLLDNPIDAVPVVISQPLEKMAALEVTALDDEEKTDSASQKGSLEENELIRQIESSFTAANRNAPEEEVRFTEPSPWGNPLPERESGQLDKKLEKLVNSAKTQPVSNSAEDSYSPVVDSKLEAAVAPSVKSVRSPKKPGSLSNIELPTFHNAKVASFRR